MDGGDSEENSKRQKTFEGQHNDRVSHLPECIIHYILSFLPTKYAVGTSILSTRWKYLWTAIHNLDFCDEQYCKVRMSRRYAHRKKSFINFVDRVLHLHDRSSIYKFRLECKNCDRAHFDEWMSIVTRHQVQEFILSVKEWIPYKFPDILVTWESLRVLKIKAEVYINIPSAICFSCLKVLSLERIQFSTDQSTREVSLNFPVLEEMDLVFCKWLGIEIVKILIPAVQILTIKCLHSGLFDCEIKIFGESLRSYKLSSDLGYEYSLFDLSPLTEVFLEIYGSKKTVHRVGSLFKGISNVKHLNLAPDSIETLSLLALPSYVHSLSCLTHLTVAQGNGCSGRALMNLLLSIPNVEYLFFPRGMLGLEFYRLGRMHRTIPQSFLSHLKLVEIDSFRGTKNELWFVKFLMKNIRSMDIITMKMSRRASVSPVGWKEHIIERLGVLVENSNFVLDFS